MCLANNWLLDHPGWEIISCETLAQFVSRVEKNVDYSADVYTLRIWIRRSNIDYSQICDTVFWFKDFTPTKQDEEGNFESLEDLIESINEDILGGRINGRILQIETIKVMADEDWQCRSDATFISDGKTSRDIHRFSNVLLGVRIFFQVGECFEDEIVLADFVPEFDLNDEEADEDSDEDAPEVCNRPPKTEKYSSLIKRASDWLVRNPELNFCNAQATDLRVRGK